MSQALPLRRPSSALILFERLKRFYFSYRPLIVLGMGVYLCLLHLVAFALFWQSDLPGVVAWKLGLGSRWAELNSRYHGRTGLLRRQAEAALPGAVFFVGDSQLGTLDVSSLADRAVQLSIGGDTARGVVARLNDYPLANARLVFIHAGTNDLNYRRPEDMRRIFQRMMRVIPAKVPVILSAIMPVDEKVFRRYDNATIRAANSIIKEVCATRPNCTFLDARKALMDESGGFDPRLHQGDGLHPTAEAYRRWAATIAPALAPLHRL